MDKIALIKAKIERLYNDKSYSEDRWDMGYDCACEDIMSFLSTLSEEPDKSLNEAAKEYCKTIFHKPFSENQQEEHIVYDGDRYVGFIAGAKWQAKHLKRLSDEQE